MSVGTIVSMKLYRPISIVIPVNNLDSLKCIKRIQKIDVKAPVIKDQILALVFEYRKIIAIKLGNKLPPSNEKYTAVDLEINAD